jgi:hypothetical protein
LIHPNGFFLCRGLIYQAHLFYTINNVDLMNQVPAQDESSSYRIDYFLRNLYSFTATMQLDLQNLRKISKGISLK